MTKKNNELSVMMDTETMFQKAQWMIDRKIIPSGIKKVEDVVTIINKGHQLDMDPLTALNSMHLIQGNVAIKSSVIPGLLAKAGIGVELIKDYEPVMKKVPAYLRGEDGKILPADKDGNFKYYKNPDGSIAYKDEQVKVNGNPEYVTTIRFHRFYKDMNKTISSDYSFYWSDAVAAQWNKKDNWKKLPRFMMYARCVVRGARGVASDIIGGLYDTHEVIEFSKAEFTIDPKTNDAIPTYK
jgi:hypothetical protein